MLFFFFSIYLLFSWIVHYICVECHSYYLCFQIYFHKAIKYSHFFQWLHLHSHFTFISDNFPLCLWPDYLKVFPFIFQRNNSRFYHVFCVLKLLFCGFIFIKFFYTFIGNGREQCPTLLDKVFSNFLNFLNWILNSLIFFYFIVCFFKAKMFLFLEFPIWSYNIIFLDQYSKTVDWISASIP